MKRVTLSFVLLLATSLAGCNQNPGKVTTENLSQKNEIHAISTKESLLSTDSTQSTGGIFTTAPIEKDAERSNSYSNILSIEDNQVDCESTITKTISLQDFREQYFFRDFSPSFSFQQTIEQINADFPIECLRKKKENQRYVVYEAKESGRVFVFFRDQVVKSHCVYVLNTKKYRDFKSIKTGSLFDDVLKIDKAAEIWSSVNDDIGMDGFRSLHLLTDGLLAIRYKQDTKRNAIVDEIQLFTDFRMEANGTTYDYSILPQDYPQ
ncbi:MAG: hypothetical protein LBC83_04435 [Oscillospiraceae bacterium]|jgi:hypothetical protein|nr:hypothetical protein [Oscillospiraceae bacterium]